MNFAEVTADETHSLLITAAIHNKNTPPQSANSTPILGVQHLNKKATPYNHLQKITLTG